MAAILLMMLVRAGSIGANGLTSPKMPDPPASIFDRPACQMTSTLVLAAYQAWFGLDDHLPLAPYTSTDPTAIARHLESAQDRCIGGFVVDWYGPPAGLANDEDRSFINQATTTLLQQAENTPDFRVGLMYDEGTVRNVTAFTTTRVISDLLYAQQYFASSHYLTLSGRPALFIFPYTEVDRNIDWTQVRQELEEHGLNVTLLTWGPDPSAPTHNAYFDGFYSWVKPNTDEWLLYHCTDQGLKYLAGFYQTMQGNTNGDKLTVGGVWPGFYALAWDQGRCMERRCGQTWHDTWALAEQFRPPVVLIETWNDFEEGTDTEYGVTTQAVWQENFDPLQPRNWNPQFAGAEWEDIAGPGARLREDEPNADYGKVESSIITTTVESYPFLVVNVTAVDPGASYTIQILDKDTDGVKDILKEVTSPGAHLIDLAREMGWHGKHSFTINIWVGGENKSVTFDLVRVQSGCRDYVPFARREG
jgi:hypothetical protein